VGIVSANFDQFGRTGFLSWNTSGMAGRPTAQYFGALSAKMLSDISGLLDIDDATELVHRLGALTGREDGFKDVENGFLELVNAAKAGGALADADDLLQERRRRPEVGHAFGDVRDGDIVA